DTNALSTDMNIFIYFSQKSGDKNVSINTGTDRNIFAPPWVCDSNALTTARTCFYIYNVQNTNLDDNFFIDINAVDWNSALSNIALTGRDANFYTAASSFMVDTNSPRTSWDGNHNSWQNMDANIHLTCVDMNGGTDRNVSGCLTIRFRVDTNATTDITWGAWQTYATNIMIASDGNFAVDFNSIDRVGNAGDQNLFYVLRDTNAGTPGFDFNVSVSFGDFNNFDVFYGRDQNIRVRVFDLGRDINLIGRRSVSPWVDFNVRVNYVRMDANQVRNDVNLGIYPRWDVNLNTGVTLDTNFTSVYLTFSGKDGAGNVLNDQNFVTPLVLYSMRVPNGFSDQNSATNLQDINNFADVNNLLFVKRRTNNSVLSRLFFRGPLNLTDATTLAGLVSLGTNMTIATSSTTTDTRDINVHVDSAALTAFNTDANLWFYDLPYASRPGILRSDSNCGSACTDYNYMDSNGMLYVHVTGFSDDTTDGNAPVLSGAHPSGSIGDQSSADMNVLTNELATCRYSTSDVAYASMGNTTTQATSHTWSIAISRGETKTLYIRCMDRVGNVNSSSTSLTFNRDASGGSSPGTTPASETGTDTGGTSPGPSSGGGGELGLSRDITVSAGETKEVQFNYDNRYLVTDVEVTAKETLFNTTLVVAEATKAEVGSDPAVAVPGSGESQTIKFLEIKVSTKDKGKVDSAKLKFNVPKTTYGTDLDYRTTRLMHLDNGTWKELATTFVEEKTNTYVFEATTPGFSYFAIIADVIPVQPPTSPQAKPPVQKRPLPKNTTQTGGTPSGEAPAPQTAPAPLGGEMIFGAAAVLVVVLAVGYFVLGRKKR
ncbi:MAG: PGF-pre-PGF domain-containing protein, partial [Candidatus Diapherotrites archaeon]|nr:PGF-pre-PGF domain-containing protein [Candidatus Diapherotrites archaeon]